MSTEVAAWVGDRAISVASLDERLAALRSGPYAARLPHPDTAEGRTLRRWLVQAIATEAVIDHEAAARGIVADGECDASGELTPLRALRVGGVTAAVVAAHPLAPALRRDVVSDLAADDDEIHRYYLRNRDRHAEPFAQARARIAAELDAVERERGFARWLDERCAELVRLEPGYEHPGDPRHPDATHRH